jgi:hypothetical protein
MNDFLTYLRHRIEETKRKLHEANERVQQAMSERDMLGADLQGYERTLAAEMRNQGMSTLPNLPTQESPPINGAGTAETNKAEFARQFVREHAATGSTPTDLFNGFVAAGVPIKKPYVYSLVQRLQKQGAIKAKRGKYYPPDQPSEAAKETIQ